MVSLYCPNSMNGDDEGNRIAPVTSNQHNVYGFVFSASRTGPRSELAQAIQKEGQVNYECGSCLCFIGKWLWSPIFMVDFIHCLVPFQNDTPLWIKESRWLIVSEINFTFFLHTLWSFSGSVTIIHNWQKNVYLHFLASVYNRHW